MKIYRSDTTEIINALDMADVAEQYGFEIKRGGFICCPFHNEKTASLKLYPAGRGWHCFGCGEGGDVISFVRKLFDLDFQSAIMRVSFDFNINISAPKHPAPIPNAIIERQKRSEELNRLNRQYADLCLCLREFPPERLDNGEIYYNSLWAVAVHQIDFVEYKIKELEAGRW